MRKILASLLVAAMVLGLVGTAFAGFSDTATHADAGYIDKATAFSWLKGYPDGSFKPAGNITRAEFAAVVVRALGLEAAAGSTAGLATKFKDVASSHWGAGYINVATNKGIIKGYPDGTFKPEANVTNAEAITMVVRALNREAEAIGEWPVGHISVAASNNIIGSGFSSGALATRADVARYVAKAADVKWKELTTNGWVDSVDKTFLKACNLEKVTGTVSATDLTNKTITIAGVTYTLDAAYIIAKNVSLLDIRGYGVDGFKNKDTGKIVFVEPSTTVTAKKGDVRGKGDTFFYLYDDTTKYELGVGATIVVNFQNASMAEVDIDDTVNFFIGTDGKVSYMNVRGYDKYRYIITDMYTAGTPYSITARSGTTTVTYTVATDAKIELNGVEAKITDLKKGDIVSIAGQTPSSNIATIVNVGNKVVSGKITAKRVTASDDGYTRYYASVDGVEYRFETNAEVKDNEGTYNSATKILNGDVGLNPGIKVGTTVNFTLSQRGRVRVVEVVSGVADMGKVKRFVTGSTASYDSWVLDMKGTEMTYEIAKNASGTSMHAGFDATIDPGDYVALTIDNDGRINGVEKLVTVSPTTTVILGDVYSGDRIVTIGGIAYIVTNDTLLYVNDSPGTLGAVAKDQKAAVAFPATGIKLRALVVDTFAKMDTAAFVANRSSVKGYDKAAEAGALIQVYSDSGMTVMIGQDTADGPSGGLTAGNVSGRTAGTGFNGGFVVNFATPLTAATTVYVKVTDKFGNVTSAPVNIP